jgi:hypothetical protein
MSDLGVERRDVDRFLTLNDAIVPIAIADLCLCTTSWSPVAG